MRVFKWIPCFDPQIESSVAPVWIRLPNLPAHLFEKNALFTLAAKIEKPLRMEEPTADQSRPDLACISVELDLTSPRVQAAYLNIERKTYRQQVLYENCPPFYSSCNHLGHDITNFIAKHNNDKSQAHVEHRPSATMLNTLDAFTLLIRSRKPNRDRGQILCLNPPSSLHIPTALDKAYNDHASRDSHHSPYPRYSLRMHVTVMIPQVRGLILYYRNRKSLSYRPNLKRFSYDDSPEAFQSVDYLAN
ncbi:hypothetical protein Sango_2850500 [Sesamum angolense]|uniref:DUF4283 domain-containing protein n=1 Tax=Sesamum angolense TaxID=2727404 RepID=A0AAE1W0I3_9LAMI|nr:hypothetical protein Sango_2850500 [Sesamum angolense]